MKKITKKIYKVTKWLFQATAIVTFILVAGSADTVTEFNVPFMEWFQNILLFCVPVVILGVATLIAYAIHWCAVYHPINRACEIRQRELENQRRYRRLMWVVEDFRETCGKAM